MISIANRFYLNDICRKQKTNTSIFHQRIQRDYMGIYVIGRQRSARKKREKPAITRKENDGRVELLDTVDFLRWKGHTEIRCSNTGTSINIEEKTVKKKKNVYAI